MFCICNKCLRLLFFDILKKICEYRGNMKNNKIINFYVGKFFMLSKRN